MHVLTARTYVRVRVRSTFLLNKQHSTTVHDRVSTASKYAYTTILTRAYMNREGTVVRREENHPTFKKNCMLHALQGRYFFSFHRTYCADTAVF